MLNNKIKGSIMTKVVCPDCDIEYEVKSVEASEYKLLPTFCPFCGYETTEDLDFSDDTYDSRYDEEMYDEEDL